MGRSTQAPPRNGMGHLRDDGASAAPYGADMGNSLASSSADSTGFTSDVVDEFEQQRLALFARHGFEGESRRVADREGRTTYVLRRGEGAPPTVLVHGGLSQASEWALLAGKLPGHVVVADRPGCGLSSPIDYSGVDFRMAATDWLLDVMDGIAAHQVDLVGSSMGGFFSMAFAVAHPDRVRRLILVGAPAGLDRKLPLFPRLWGNPVTGPLITRSRITDPEVLRKKVFARLLVARPERLSRAFLEVMVAAMALPGVDRAAYTMLRNVTTLRGWRPHLMMRDDMARLPVPTRFVWGDDDAFASPSSGRAMVAEMPHADIVRLADTGHLPHVDSPDAVADAIVRFLGPRPAGE